MTREDIEKSFLSTLEEINLIKRKISCCTDDREKKNLELQLKELQCVQLWHQELYNAMNNQDA